MNHSSLIYLALALVLTACGSDHRPVYSGHEESTENVPGFANGKKVSPHVKLGQSYTVDGETYVPRHQPDYVEEGMASWYGPGFHGGKTANGEKFDSAELTGAHRTLPLPSIVRVTMLSTGKQVFVRINDRGPFAHSRIIDLSRGAAEKIGLLQVGVGKVRVEYMKNESERFTELLGQGRDPKSIDLASEVLNYHPTDKSLYARGDVRVPSEGKVVASEAEKNNEWARYQPVASAHAEESTDAAGEDSFVTNEAPSQESNAAAPVSDVSSSDLPSSMPNAVVKKSENDASPFDAMKNQEQPATEMVAAQAAPIAPAAGVKSAVTGYYVQLGAFLKMDNANRIQQKYMTIDAVEIRNKANAQGQQLYHVRMGPYASQAEAMGMLEKVRAAGAEEARVIHE